MATRTRTPRGMAELSGFRLTSPDSVFGSDITPSLFAEDAAPERDGAEDRAQAERFAAARDWYFAEGASSWWADAFGHWLVETSTPTRWRSYSDAATHWNYDRTASAYRRAHGRRQSGDGWTYGEPLATDAPLPTR